MTQSIKEIAKTWDVSEADFLMFAQSIANGIERDGAAEVFKASEAKVQIDFVKAYAIDSVRKFTNFQTIMMTNKQARDAFDLDIFQKLKKEV